MPDNEPQYLYLTTTGHQTGNPHEIEIWYVKHQGRYYLVSEMRQRSHWVRNIEANPAITLRIGQRDAALIVGTGRIINSSTEPQLAAQIVDLMNAKYSWSDGLIVELAPA